jgi:hypothetical protein
VLAVTVLPLFEPADPHTLGEHFRTLGGRFLLSFFNIHSKYGTPGSLFGGTVLIQKCIICIHFKIYHRKATIFFGCNMVTAATQPEHNRILSSPVQKPEGNPKLNDIMMTAAQATRIVSVAIAIT